ncbi:hypothetical protein Thermus77412_23590 [Thermus antranikianii]
MESKDREKIIVAFLGTGDYKELAYILDGKEYLTPFTQEALVRHYPGRRLLVFLTPQAREKNLLNLQSRLAPLGGRVEPVAIPEGKSEAEHWEIFNRIVDAIPEGAELVVDVTHGFRSQPILALAVLRFLEVAKDVRAKRLLYGAVVGDGRGEFMDLTPFLALLDWTQATRDLMQYGWGRPLAELMSRLQDATWKAGAPGGEQAPVRLTKLKPLGETLGQLTLALELLRVKEATEQVAQLLKRLAEVETELGKLPAAQPMRYLLGTIRERYQGMFVADPFSPEGLRAQGEMVELLLKTGSLAQAVALMREMMVTKVCLDRNLDPVEERSVAESHLGVFAQRSRRAPGDEKGLLGQLWNELSDLRNDVAHAGMRPNPTPAKTLEMRLREVWKRVKGALGLEEA